MCNFINVWKSNNRINPYQLDTNIYDNAADALQGYNELKSVTGMTYLYTYKIKDGDNLSFSGEKVDVRNKL